MLAHRSQSVETPRVSSEIDATRAFIEWARDSAIALSVGEAAPSQEDLAHLGEIIGDARVVSLTEGVHFAHEPLSLRNRLFEYLVLKKGFTTIAIESGIVEGREAYDFARAGRGEIDRALATGLSWTFDRLPHNRELLLWLRAYNSDPAHRRKLAFYGFDLAGSPANSRARRGHRTALDAALGYLAEIDAESAAALRDRVASLLDRMGFAWRANADHSAYSGLSLEQRNAMTATIADLIALLERKEAAYIQAGTREDYQWGYIAALNARGMDNWLRQIPRQWVPVKSFSELTSEQRAVIAAAGNVRDRMQADNLAWIAEREGPSAKILVFAERGHLSNVPLYRDVTGHRAIRLDVAGTYLKQRLGSQLVTIGNSIGEGRVGCDSESHALIKPVAGSIDGVAGAVADHPYVLDLRNAAPSAMPWLEGQQAFGHSSARATAAPARAFDVILYIDRVRPAC